MFLSVFWWSASDIKEKGTEERVVITGTESFGKSRYFVFYHNTQRKNFTHSRRHKVGDEIPVIIHGYSVLDGTKSDSTLTLTIRDFGTLYFWCVFIGLVIVPLFIWLSHLPDKAFAWIPAIGTKRKLR
ncbi:hypothetical protein [Pelagicoccus mobilis]|uniref:hypothetical protein n=1 Tax=Pelagicoccus mobilis TaxID=415221 RepID=UPI0019042464|nr:hypothetical protein [Pelagicoccus mobilis]